MTKLSDLGPAHAVTVHSQPGAADLTESSRFYECETCSQIVDKRDIRQVIWHEQPQHEPLELDG